MSLTVRAFVARLGASMCTCGHIGVEHVPTLPVGCCTASGCECRSFYREGLRLRSWGETVRAWLAVAA